MAGPRVVIANYAFDPAVTSPEGTLQALVALREFAGGLRAADVEVSVVQRFWRDVALTDRGVEYEFVADAPAGGARGGPAGGRATVRGRASSLGFNPRLAARVARRLPQVVHVNGLVFPLQTRLLRRRLGPGPALFVQHHAEAPWRGWRGALQRWGLAGVDGFLFPSAAQAAPWRESGVIRPASRVFEVMEGSTGLTPRPRAEARAHRPLAGAPALLWVGRLQAVKDPLTLLAGLELLLRAHPAAHLTMIYGEADLLPEVTARLAASPRLHAAVTLVGRVPHGELACYYAAADYFVAASLREGSGFALAEALASGLVPIVTRIPSFVKMTADGAFGGLWRPGDAADFARAASAVLARPRAELSRAAAAHYREHLSSAAIGREARAAYAAVLASRAAGTLGGAGAGRRA